MRLANLRNYIFMLLRLTADRPLKIRGMPQENLNNIILFPAFYPQYKFPYCTSKILNFHLKEVFLCFKFSWYLTHVEQTACGGESTFNVCEFLFFLLK